MSQTTPRRLLLLCPGRGSYGRAQIGTLPPESPTVRQLNQLRAEAGRPTLTALDATERFFPALHLAGEHASLLTFGYTLADLESLDPDKAQTVAVVGNSMGWYTALAAAGALPLLAAARLVETLGAYQEDNVIGAQVLYPTAGDDWRAHAVLTDLVEEALKLPGVYRSIRLGGMTVFGCTREGLAALNQTLPKLQRGDRSFPLQLPLHSAFHTPLMALSSARAQVDLADLPWRSPALPMVGGDGEHYGLTVSPAAIARYTLTTQVTDTFDLNLCLRAAMGEHGPDAVLLPGPGNSLGAATAQILIQLGWRGLRDRRDFEEVQASPRPLVISMDRPEQRALVCR